jgi:hypothetical protein
MKDIVIEKTENTPGIKMLVSQKLFEITGESRPENARAFFEPVYEWIENYGAYMQEFSRDLKSAIYTTVNFKLEYFNSSSAKFFTDFIKHFHNLTKANQHVKVEFNWFYEADDDDLKDSGAEIIKMTGIAMNLVTH